MRIALIADVHANLAALDAVLAFVAPLGIDAVWDAGDATGYGPHPDETVRRLREHGALSVLGNYDRKVLAMPTASGKWKRRKHPLKLQAFTFACRSLSGDSRAYLAELPTLRRLTVCGHRVLLTHGSPVSMSKGVRPDTPTAQLREWAAAADAHVVVCGHTHAPYLRNVDGVTFINPGSVGRPDDGDPRAACAVLDLCENRPPFAAHMRVPYDVERTVAALEEQGLPEAFAAVFESGRELKYVLKRQPKDYAQ